MKLALLANDKTLPKSLGALLKEKLRRKKKNIFNYAFGFFVFIGILFYTTNIPGTVVQILDGFRSQGSRGEMEILEEFERASTEADGEGTMKCNLPKLDPFDPSIVEFIKPPPEIEGSAQHPLIFRTNFESNLIRIKGKGTTTGASANHECCYRSSHRRGTTDTAMRFSKSCYPITKDVTTISPLHEFIQVHCKIKPLPLPTVSNSTTENQNQTTNDLEFQDFTDFFAFVPQKPSTEFRIANYERKHGGGQEAGAGDRLSVVILGLDAQSRMNFIRQMPSTHSYLMTNLSAIELRGYTKVGDNTFPNVVPFLTGLNISELSELCWPNRRTSYFDHCPFIWKNFAAKGYRTSYGEDSVWMGTFNYDKKGFLAQPTDYYLNPLTYQSSKQIGHEVWGNAKLCYGGRLSFEILLDYIVKTAVAFSMPAVPKPYFQFIWANSLFHDYLNHPKLGDELLASTLKFLYTNDFLNNSIFILTSDHGMRWGSIRSTYQGKLEERMPMVYFLVPPWFEAKYGFAVRRMRENAEKLTTPFDMNETLKDILNLETRVKTRVQILKRERKISAAQGEVRGRSLFLRIPRGRTCRSAGIEEHWCVCNTMQTISKSLPIVEAAADFIVSVINGITSNRTQCAKLGLRKINSVLRKIDGETDLGSEAPLYASDAKNYNATTNSSTSPVSGVTSTVQLQITLVTLPGDAVFEATVYGHIRNWHLSGEISRLNLYRDTSLCVSDQIIQKFCHCITDEVT